MSVPIHCSNHDIAAARACGEDVIFSLQEEGGETLEALVAELARLERDGVAIVANGPRPAPVHLAPARLPDDEDIILLEGAPPSMHLPPLRRPRRAVPARLSPPMPRL
ncbi:MAG: hypothetical protein AB7D57_14930 [Desulfovibrionaceae bacterium]